MTRKTFHLLTEIVSAQQRGEARGIPSICSAHPNVLETVLENGKTNGMPVLIEATCNQVNQFGGYTGMKPADFVAYIKNMIVGLGFPAENLILGGDHLGPTPWQEEPAAEAMNKSKVMVRDYVLAGFTKIHLDASMKLRDDPAGPLAVDVAAERAAQLARVAEDTFIARGAAQMPHYVIGTEVPIAGGLQVEEELKVTEISDLVETLEKSRAAFLSEGLESAWDRVVAVVVQPGVEFGDSSIQEYDPNAAADLAQFIQGQNLIYEAHSTDYQDRQALRQMVKDHFAILKVGPALTFAYREALFALAIMEDELFPATERSNLLGVIEQMMLVNPAHWRKYYRGDDISQRFARRYSYSDRVRYYWAVPEVQSAVKQLMRNFGRRLLPLSLVSQYMPIQYAKIRAGRIENTAQAMIKDKILDVLGDYQFAFEPSASLFEQ